MTTKTATASTTSASGTIHHRLRRIHASRARWRARPSTSLDGAVDEELDAVVGAVLDAPDPGVEPAHDVAVGEPRIDAHLP